MGIAAHPNQVQHNKNPARCHNFLELIEMWHNNSNMISSAIKNCLIIDLSQGRHHNKCNIDDRKAVRDGLHTHCIKVLEQVILSQLN